jgi:hypothetical protein
MVAECDKTGGSLQLIVNAFLRSGERSLYQRIEVGTWSLNLLTRRNLLQAQLLAVPCGLHLRK